MRVAMLLIILALSGCADMTPRQRYWTEAAVGVLVVGAIATERQRSGAVDPTHDKTISPPNCAANPVSCQ